MQTVPETEYFCIIICFQILGKLFILNLQLSGFSSVEKNIRTFV